MTPLNHLLEHSHCNDNVLLNCVFSSKTNFHLVLSRLRSYNINQHNDFWKLSKNMMYIFFYWLIDWISFRIPFENVSLTLGRLHFSEELHSLGLFSGLTVFEQEGIESSSCHTCFDTEPRITRSHPSDLLTLIPRGGGHILTGY